MKYYHSNFYVGIRFYLLSFASIPFLVFESRKPKSLLLALMVPCLILVFYDFILNYFGVGYRQVGLQEPEYEFNSIRVVLAYLVIGGCTYALKLLMERSEETNERLRLELEVKNNVIKQQADNEVHQLNQQLNANLQELNEREFILNQSQRIAKIGSWEYRIENAFLFWSEEMYNIFGLDKSNVLKLENLEEALGAEGGKSVTQATNELLKSGQPYDLTFRTRTPLGYNKWFRIYAYPIIDKQLIVGVRGVCHDITFFKEAEEKLRASEAKFSKAFENYPDFIMLIREEDLLVVDVNQRITSILGFQKNEVIGRSARAMDLFLTEENRQKFIQSYNETGYFECECHWKRKDGRIIQVSITAIRIAIEGQYYRMSVVQDITERKAAEEKFLKAFDLNPDLMLLVREEDLVFVEANQRLQEITGFSREEVIGFSAAEQQFEIWDVPEQREAFFKNYLSTGKAFLEARLRRKDGSTFYATVSGQQIMLSQVEHLIAVVRDISDRKMAEHEKERARLLLGERIKELTTLYRVSQLLFRDERPVHEVLQEVVRILPEGWQHADISAARIFTGETEFISDNFSESSYRLIAEFSSPYEHKGKIEIVYFEERPQETEGPFLAEERNLVNVLAEMIGSFLFHKHEEEELSKSEANLSATINNTEILIWSVDRNFKLRTFNKPFYNFVRDNYYVSIEVGTRILQSLETVENVEQMKKWEQHYLRALAGEIVTLEETSFDIDFQYSLSPILKNKQIIGVSVFADDVTRRNASNRELAEANKKIGELRLMALRSVMSPHFIFNVLNSIQYFITKNDRLNAITYLSTFSKLIRSILTHSVDNKIKLADELELLKNYVQLEMLRFENKFSLVLDVDSNVDVDAIEIPSLLVQPYVENAILHGLYSKHSQGTLTIRVREGHDVVIFEIEDDGVGRIAAMHLRQQNFPTHKSMGTKLTEERLKLINAQHQAKVAIDDLVDHLGNSSGTKVTIKIDI